MKHKSKVLICFILILAFVACGCWDRREVENLAIFTVMNFDWVKENSVDKWQISTSILQTSTSSKDEGSQSERQERGEQVWKSTGNTIQDAISNYLVRTPRMQFYSHISVMIIGERAAKEKLREVIEDLARYRENRPRTYLLVTKGDAFDTMRAKPVQSPSFSKEITTMAKQTSRTSGFSMGITYLRFTQLLLSSDRDAVLPQIKILSLDEQKVEGPGKNKSAYLEGFGIFRGGKLVDWLDREEARGFLFITENNNRLEIYEDVNIDDRMFGYIIGETKRKIKVSLDGDELSVKINIQAWGGVTDVQAEKISAEELRKLETACENKIKYIVMKAINKAKENEADIFGFTEELHRSSLSSWKRIESHWRESFRESHVDVEVKAKIVNTGVNNNSLHFKE